jgi:hypothetical protein
MEQQLCSKCNDVLPVDGKLRKRLRSRRCRECNNTVALDRRRQDPIARLQHKWQNNCMKHYKNADSTLWSRATVEYVWNRWDKKCAITEQTDPMYLCIVPAIRDKLNTPTRDQLVVLSTHIAQSMSRHNNEKRLAKFSEEARAKINF